MMETGKQLECLNRTKPGSSPALKSLIVIRQFSNNQIINDAKLYLHSAISSSSIKLSLQKHPFLLALRRWGRFARRNVCDSATEIPY